MSETNKRPPIGRGGELMSEDELGIAILAAASRRQFERDVLHASIEDLHAQLEESHVREIRLEAEVDRLRAALRQASHFAASMRFAFGRDDSRYHECMDAAKKYEAAAEQAA